MPWSTLERFLWMTTHEVGVVRPMMDSTWLAVDKRQDFEWF